MRVGASRELAQAIADDRFEPTRLLTIARGGLLPAGPWAMRLTAR